MSSDNKHNFKHIIFVFTAVFILCAAGVYFTYIIHDKTLLRFDFSNRDSFSQRYMFIFEFKRFLCNVFMGAGLNTWDWSIGLGADGLAFNISNLFNPFSLIMALTPARFVDVAFTATVIMRLYLTGFCFILFARKTRIKDDLIVLSAILYTFSPWMIHASLVQATFLIAPIMLPIVLLGVEKFCQGESPVLFCVSVAYTIATSFFFAYVIGLITLLYYIVWNVTNRDWRSLKFIIFDACRFIGYGLIGILISGLTLVITLFKYSASTASTGVSSHFLMTMQQVLRLPMKLIDWITIFGSDSMIGMAPICIILLPGVAFLAYKRSTNAWMAIILMISTGFPIVCSAFNFFSYPSGRWMFAVSFFIALSASECLQLIIVYGAQIKVLCVTFFLLFTGYLFWLHKILTANELRLVTVNYLFMLTFMVLIIVPKATIRQTWFRRAVCILTTAGLIISYNVAIGIDNEGYEGSDGYLNRGEAQKLMDSTPQHVGVKIEDNDFFRIDQIDESTGNRKPHAKVNEAMYFGNRSNYVFNSSVDARWLKYNKLLGNNMGYYTRVSPNSNDNRFGLDLLSGTRYFIGSDKLHPDASSYAGYGFELYDIIDGTEVLRSKYHIGLGSVYDKYMYESDWLSLSYPDREIAMLQAVILPNGQETHGLEELRPSAMHTGISELKYTLKKDASDQTVLHLSADNADNCAIILSIQGVDAPLQEKTSAIVRNGIIEKSVIDHKGTERALSDIKDFTMYLGTGKDAARDITLHLNCGEDKLACSYEKIVLYQIPLKTYDIYGKERSDKRLRTIYFGDDRYKGTVNCDEASVLYFSIIDDGGWDIYADGEICDKIKNVNIAFTGVYLPEGSHTIELRYHTRGLIPGIAITSFGIIVLIFATRKRACRS